MPSQTFAHHPEPAAFRNESAFLRSFAQTWLENAHRCALSSSNLTDGPECSEDRVVHEIVVLGVALDPTRHERTDGHDHVATVPDVVQRSPDERGRDPATRDVVVDLGVDQQVPSATTVVDDEADLTAVDRGDEPMTIAVETDVEIHADPLVVGFGTVGWR